MKLFKILALSLSLLTTPMFAQAPAPYTSWVKNGHPLEEEHLRIEPTESGSLMVWVRNLSIPRTDVTYVDFTFKLRPDALPAAGHIAVGIGQLYEGLEQIQRGETATQGPLGEGFIIGSWTGCYDATKPLVTFESYYTGTVLDADSCYAISLNTKYRMLITITADYNVKYTLYDANNIVLASRSRAWPGVHVPHNKGFFLIPVAGEPKYDLLSLQVGRMPTGSDRPIPKPKQN